MIRTFTSPSIDDGSPAGRARLSTERFLRAAEQLRIALERNAYDPNQPRIPTGQTGAGRWTDGVSGGDGSPTNGGRRSSGRILVADASNEPSPEFLSDLKRRVDEADERLANAYARASSSIEISHAETNRARLAIAEKALAERDSARWAYGVAKGNYPAGSNKCNLFVYDILKNVEADPPLANGGVLYNWFGLGAAKYPLLAGQWADPSREVSGWSLVTGSLRPGDVVAVEESSGNATGHTAIYVGFDSGIHRTVGANARSVSYTGWPWRKQDVGRPVVRRYVGERRP